AGGADARTDIYALGCLTFELSCGRPPFDAVSIPVVYAQQMTDSLPRARSVVPDLPEELDDLLTRMLARSSAGRPNLLEVAATFPHRPAPHPRSPHPTAPKPSTLTTATTVDMVKRSGKRRWFPRSRRAVAIGLGALMSAISLLVAT